MEEIGVRTVETSEANTHSFIVKIWLEVTAEETRPAVWCGQITHGPSGERRELAGILIADFYGQQVRSFRECWHRRVR